MPYEEKFQVSSRQGWNPSQKLGRLQKYILACPHHGMDEWLVLQSFYNGLTTASRAHLNAAAGGAYLDLTIAKATPLIEKMVSNQGWNEERSQPRTKGGIHTVKETDMLAAKLDLLLKKLNEGNRPQMHVPVHAMNSYLTCEVCGDVGHSGNDYPETREDAAYINNNTGFHPQGGQGWGQARPPFQGEGNNFNSNFNSNFNQPSLRDLVFGQAKINESLNKNLAANDKILERINAKVETHSSAIKNQLSFNKMIETQLAQLAAVVPVSETGKILGQPESVVETANMISTGWGNLPQ